MLKVLFSDGDIAVIVKPVGLDSEHGVPDAIKKLLGGEVYTLHRLDKNVGGVMVYARSAPAAATLSRVIAEGQMVKEYLAQVHGCTEASGVMEDLLFKDSSKNKVFVVKRERRGVKQAKLEYTTLKTDGEVSLVHIRLHTGRSHQIRVQFASRGFSLLGDRKYGARDTLMSPRLYSHKITFPYKNEMLSFWDTPEWAK